MKHSLSGSVAHATQQGSYAEDTQMAIGNRIAVSTKGKKIRRGTSGGCMVKFYQLSQLCRSAESLSSSRHAPCAVRWPTAHGVCLLP